jgi:hypothetical protein
MKANFKLSKDVKHNEESVPSNDNYSKDITKEEFEDFIVKSGAAGSFMVFRSSKKEDELGLEEL